MLREELVFVGTCDISGHVRGKAFPSQAMETRRRKGIGWVPSNLMMSAFGPIYDTPFGTGGDLMIIPDSAGKVRVDFGDGSAPEHLFLGDIRHTDGSDWECCPRAFLRRALAALDAACGLRLIAAFEQEFVYTGVEGRPAHAYSLSAWRRQNTFGETFIAAMRAAGVTPDSFLPEYGSRQYEVTVAPAPALTAADHAIITREMARATAHRLGHRAIFSPKPDPEEVGNGVHIHFSLQDADGTPMTYAAGERLGLSKAAQSFCAGVLHHLPAITAVTAPSPVSYLRLVPNRWAPTEVNIVQQDRGAALRVCPVFAAADPAEVARQYNVEFRATDASASPYMALGALVMAGADGVARGMTLPTSGTEIPPLPRSLDEALEAMEGSAAVQSWFGPVFLDAYLRFKRSELARVAEMDPDELCRRYAELY